MSDTPSSDSCQLFARGRCHYGPSCKYAHAAPGSPTSSTSSPSSPRSPAAASPYPLRPAAAACQYYLKTGKCNYGSRCRFNHPSRPDALVDALNRRDCFDYVQTASCPYGKACKYNHPEPALKADHLAPPPWDGRDAWGAWGAASPPAPAKTVPVPVPVPEGQADWAAGAAGAGATVEAVEFGGQAGYFVYVPSASSPPESAAPPPCYEAFGAGGGGSLFSEAGTWAPPGGGGLFDVLGRTDRA